MRAYSISELAGIAKQLQTKQCEGDYWDFKQEWWDAKDPDMIKDILCFANTVHDRDCFIILGIENNNYTVVPFQKPRKKQADILDTLSKVKFAGENIPDVSVYSNIPLDGGIVDVMVIHDSDRTPFYLSTDKQSLKQGLIYTRTGDRNTAADTNATPREIELLWKKRFHLLKPVYEQFIELLKEPADWQRRYDESYYHIYKPEFSICIKDDSNSKDGELQIKTFFSEMQINKNAFRTIYYCKCFDTTIQDVYIVTLDDSRFEIAYPNIECISMGDEKILYHYWLADSIDFLLQEFVLQKHRRNDCYQLDNFKKVIPIFQSQNEKNLFKYWIELNSSTCLEIYASVKKEKQHPFICDSFADDAIAGKTVVQLLETFRKTEKNHV